MLSFSFSALSLTIFISLFSITLLSSSALHYSLEVREVLDVSRGRAADRRLHRALELKPRRWEEERLVVAVAAGAAPGSSGCSGGGSSSASSFFFFSSSFLFLVVLVVAAFVLLLPPPAPTTNTLEFFSLS